MQQEAIDVGRLLSSSDYRYTRSNDKTIAQEAMGKCTIEKDIAQHIKRTVSLSIRPGSQPLLSLETLLLI